MCSCGRTTLMIALRTVLVDIFIVFRHVVLIFIENHTHPMWLTLEHQKSVPGAIKLIPGLILHFILSHWLIELGFSVFCTVLANVHNFRTDKDFCLKFGMNMSNCLL